MNILRHTLLFSAILLSLNVFGQAIKTDFDKKIIYTDSLNLPRNTSAMTLITLLPELLQRPGSDIHSNYVILVEGMSVGSAAEVALSELQIVDVEMVVVSESPLSSYRNNGQGGSINLVLRSKGTVNENRWGSVSATAESPFDLSPQFSFGMRNKKFMLRSIFLGEVYNLSDEVQTINFDKDNFLSRSNDDTDNKFRSQLARTYMQYSFTDRTMLKFDFSEIFTFSETTKTTDYDDNTSVFRRDKSLNLQAHLMFRHATPRHTFVADVEYDHVPSWKKYDISGVYKYRNDLHGDNLSGKIDFKSLLYNRRNAKGDLSIGMNFNATFGSETVFIYDEKVAGEEMERSVPQNDTYYIMPYLSFTTTIGKFALKASGEFQHFRYKFDRIGIPYSAISNDFTGKLMAEWHFSESRNLRFILDRKLQRPASHQLYPYRVFNPDYFQYAEGNPDLKPMMVHEFMIDYIGTYKLADTQKLILNAGASFSNITDIIVNASSSQSGGGGLGYVQQYLSFENLGTNKIASANLMALYSKNAFSLSFTGNVYHKMLDKNTGDNHYTYYNLSLYPYFKLKDGWHGGARFVYFSRVNQGDGSLGDCAVAEMTVGKTINRLSLYLFESVYMMKNSKDISTSGDLRKEKIYQMLPNRVGVGLRYTF